MSVVYGLAKKNNNCWKWVAVSNRWHSNACPMEAKRKIIRTMIEEIVVQLDESQMLQFIIHWKGRGCHTEFEMEKPRSPIGKATDLEDVERKIGYEEGEMARVLNKLNRGTGKGVSWSQSRVADLRRTHGIASAPNLKNAWAGDPEFGSGCKFLPCGRHHDSEAC